MRLLFLFFLLIVVVLGSGYFYLSTMAVCVTPIQYRIGTFDSRFGITPEVAKDALIKAEAVWESVTDRELFTYNEAASFTVNFVFDERQAIVFDQHETEDRLNTVEEQNQKINAEFKVLEEKFKAKRTQYEQAVATYNSALQTLNQKIEAYNTADEPSRETEEVLNQARRQLEAEVRKLDEEATVLNQMSNDLNTLARRGNIMIEVYNQGVQSYNSRFGDAREFTQGDYQGDSINVYTFLDEAELIRVLVHEFGHALGMGHVDNDVSMMYDLMANQPAIASLSAEDVQAFATTCGADTDLKNRLITIINSYLSL